MFSIFGVSGSAISAQSQRLNVVASNLANADAVAGPDGQGYKGRQVVFETVPMGSDASSGVRVSTVRESNEPLRNSSRRSASSTPGDCTSAPATRRSSPTARRYCISRSTRRTAASKPHDALGDFPRFSSGSPTVRSPLPLSVYLRR